MVSRYFTWRGRRRRIYLKKKVYILVFTMLFHYFTWEGEEEYLSPVLKREKYPVVSFFMVLNFGKHSVVLSFKEK